MSPENSEADKAGKQYEELKPRQQALVDVIAEDRQDDIDRTAEELLEEAAERSGTDPYNRSYLYEFKRRYEEIIDERTQVLANEREDHDGSVRIEVGSNSYEGPEEGLDTTSGESTQFIQDRPVKSVLGYHKGDEDVSQPSYEPEEGEAVEHVAPRLHVDLTDAEAFEIIRHGNEKVAERVFYRLVRRLYKNQDSNSDSNSNSNSNSNSGGSATLRS